MTLDELRAEAEAFFEWPGDRKDIVTLASALLFAQEMVNKAMQEHGVVWVSVEDRLPERPIVQTDIFGKRYLVALNKKAVGAPPRGTKLERAAIVEVLKWDGECFFDVGGYHMNCFTHWAELPLSPNYYICENKIKSKK